MEQSKCRKDMAVSLVFIVFSLFMIFWGIPREISLKTLWGGSATGVTSRTFPYFACVMILVAAALELILNALRYLRLRKVEGVQRGTPVNWAGEFRALLVFGVCIVYMLLFKRLGYLLSTLLCTTLVLAILRDRKWKHYVSVYVVGGLMYVVFQYLLKINLP